MIMTWRKLIKHKNIKENQKITLKNFKNKFVEEYAKEVSKHKLNKYVLSTGNYIWHLFSWELIDSNLYLSGENAKKAYDKCDKSNAIVFTELPEHVFLKITNEYATSKDIEGCGEIYVFAEDMSWVYINTHEESIGLGPYFIKK